MQQKHEHKCTTLKMIFSECLGVFLHPQIPDFQIVAFRPNIVPS